jgi:predicted O-methyltransferase YrrM
MNTLETTRVAGVLERLFAEAETADRPFIEQMLHDEHSGIDPVALALAAEAGDYKDFYRGAAANFLCVSPEFGQLLYICTRAARARCVVEFGTSFGISTIYLACAVRDNGGGRVVSAELEPGKAERAYEHLAAAGVADIVDVRVGDARDTLGAGGIGPAVDLVHLDGALSLYKPVLQLLQPSLRPGALVVAENATPEYLDYIRDPRQAFTSLTLPLNGARGNELSVFTG